MGGGQVNGGGGMNGQINGMGMGINGMAHGIEEPHRSSDETMRGIRREEARINSAVPKTQW